MARMSLPPGFRFHPTDVELIMYYLKRKVMGKKLHFEVISELNIYKFSPWDLPDKSCLKSKDLEWYFFCPRERKYASGSRMNRATEKGYWKTTGKDRPVIYKNSSVGMVKTLVFHQGSAPHGQRTDWVIHEYRIENKNLADLGGAQDAYVLCKVFHKSGPGPKNGAQYGAPFKEEDWDDDEDFPIDSLLPDGPSPAVPPLSENMNTSASMSIVGVGNAPGLSLNEPRPYLVETSNDEGLLDGENSSMVTIVVDPGNSSGWSLSKPGLSTARHSAHDVILDTPDDIHHLLAYFSDDNPFLTTGNENNENLGDLDHGKATKVIPNPDGNDPFNGLEDLSNLVALNGGGDTRDIGCNTSSMLMQDDTFLELDDLAVPLNLSSEYSVTEQMQTSGLCGPCNSSGSGGNFSGHDSCLTDFHQVSVMPDLPERQVNSTNVFHTPFQGNFYHSTNAAYNLDFTYYKQQEEIRNASGNLGRGRSHNF